MVRQKDIGLAFAAAALPIGALAGDRLTPKDRSHHKGQLLDPPEVGDNVDETRLAEFHDSLFAGVQGLLGVTILSMIAGAAFIALDNCFPGPAFELAIGVSSGFMTTSAFLAIIYGIRTDWERPPGGPMPRRSDFWIALAIGVAVGVLVSIGPGTTLPNGGLPAQPHASYTDVNGTTTDSFSNTPADVLDPR